VLGRDLLGLSKAVDDPANGVRPVLGLRRQLQLDHPLVDIPQGKYDHFGRTARQVDRHVAPHLELRIVHVAVAGADDLVDLLDVRQEADRLWAAERPHLVDAEQLGRSRDQPRP